MLFRRTISQTEGFYPSRSKSLFTQGNRPAVYKKNSFTLFFLNLSGQAGWLLFLCFLWFLCFFPLLVSSFRHNNWCVDCCDACFLVNNIDPFS